MDITYLGHSSFKIKTKTVTIVTDPYDSQMVGLKYPKHTEADIVTVSHDHQDHNAVENIEGNPYVITGPGEYEVKGVFITGISVFHDNVGGKEKGRNTMYRFVVDNVSIVHCGDLGHVLSGEQAEDLEGVDILMIPVGGLYTINPHEAANVIGEIEPSIVIPMHYGTAALNQKVFDKLTPLEPFLKEVGQESNIPVPKLSITKDKLPSELQIVVLQ